MTIISEITIFLFECYNLTIAIEMYNLNLVRMKLRAGDQAWRELVDRLLDSAEERPAGYKKMFFMEKMGFQDHTVSLLTGVDTIV